MGTTDVRNERNRELVVDGCVSIEEAQRFMSLSRSKLYEMMNAGLLAYVKLGRSRRIPRRAMLDALAGNLIAS